MWRFAGRIGLQDYCTPDTAHAHAWLLNAPAYILTLEVAHMEKHSCWCIYSCDYFNLTLLIMSTELIPSYVIILMTFFMIIYQTTAISQAGCISIITISCRHEQHNLVPHRSLLL